MDSINPLINNMCIFDFHHVDETIKEHKRDWIRKGFEKKIKEGKIELLCSNCHRIKHFGKQEYAAYVCYVNGDIHIHLKLN